MGHRPFVAERTRVSLFRALLRARREHGPKTAILEDQERRVLTYDDIVRAAFALGARLAPMLDKSEAVGLMLPSSAGAVATFFAIHAIGRTPAMLNFTAGTMNLKAACGAAKLRRILTSRRFVSVAKLEGLIEELEPIADITYLEDVRAKIGLADKLGALVKASFAEHFAPKADPDDVGVILFTSGSYGTPRGAVLSHANLVANVEQVAAHIDFDPSWSFFSPLPIFHCFGLTGGALLPIFTGHKTFLYPSPLHTKEIPKLVRDCRASVMLATDTFAQQYARTAEDEDLAGVSLMVCGAERVKSETRDLYRTRFGVHVLEGYGATEAAPVISVNQPDADRPGSVGRFLPGIEWRLEPVPGIAGGEKLIVRGPNVMKGYLDPLKPSGFDLLPDGWHDTGDVVTIDADGFCTILGRVKRFAKIGGEMVSLNAVENYAQQVWPMNTHAAVALPDPRKGERIILFSDYREAEPGAFLAWAQSNGASELAVPKKIIAIDEVPVLGTGKTDYVALQKLAQEKAATAEAA